MPGWAWPILAAVGTAILGPLAVRGVNALLDWNSRLLVRVMVNQGFKKSSTYQEIDDWKDSKRVPGDRLSTDWPMMERLRTALNSEGYIRFELTNKSRKKLSLVTICSHTANPAVQVNDGELRAIKAEEPLALGDLQPGRTIVVHILVSSLFAYDSIRGIRHSFSISADELGRVAYQYPLQDHIKLRIYNRCLTLVFWVMLCVALFSMFAKPVARWFGIEL
jgi:hypothetical protein